MARGNKRENMAENEDQSMAQALQERGILTPEQVEKAKEIQKKFGGAWSLKDVLLARRLVTEEQLESLQDAGDTLSDVSDEAAVATPGSGEEPDTLLLEEDGSAQAGEEGGDGEGDDAATLITEGEPSEEDGATLITGEEPSEEDGATLITGGDPSEEDGATLITGGDSPPEDEAATLVTEAGLPRSLEEAATLVNGEEGLTGGDALDDAETMVHGGDMDDDAPTMLAGGETPLGEEDLDDAATLMQESRLTPEDEALEDKVFATICLETGVATEDQIDLARAHQEVRRKEGKPYRLGAVLVESGVLEEDQVSDVLQAQQSRVFACPRCGARTSATETQPGTVCACSRCAEEMTIPDAPEEVTQVQVREYLEQKSRGPVSVSSVDGTPEAGAALQLIGSVIGGCRIVKKLGEGGMGAVYLGEHEALRRKSAIKILPATYANNPTLVARFFREARAAGKVRHPNIVEVFNVGQDQGLHFIEMEFVKGMSLKDLMDEGPLELDDCLRILRDTATGLHAAHSSDVIHRDMKPDNIMMTEDGGIIKIADFGLARSVEGESMDLTKTGQIMGTPTYISPEQADAQKTDQRTDIYSLGATFYHMLTNEKPFTGESPMVILLKHINEEPDPPTVHNPDIPPSVVAIVDKMMAKRLDQRYQSLEEVIKDIEAFQGGATISYKIKKKKKFPVKRVAAAIILAFVLMAAYFFYRESTISGAERDATVIYNDAVALYKDGEGDLLNTLEKLDEAIGVYADLAVASELKSKIETRIAYNKEFQIGKSAYDREAWTEAVKAFERARGHLVTEEVDRRLGIARFEEAMGIGADYSLQEQYQLALDTFNRAWEIAPGGERKSLAAGARKQARMNLDRANFETHLNNGNIALAKGELPDATKALLAASKILNFAVDTRLGDLEKGIADRKKTISKEKEFKGVFSDGLGKYGNQEFKSAIRYFKDAERILGETPDLLKILQDEARDLQKKLASANYEMRMVDGKSAAGKDDLWGAIESFKEALPYGTETEMAITNDEIYEVAMQIARPAWGAKDIDQADGAITEALAALPGDPDATTLRSEVKRFSTRPKGMVYVPGGDFVAGTENEIEAKHNPIRNVKLKPFYIDEHEVTNVQFMKFVEDRGYRRKEFWDEEGWALVERKCRTKDKKGYGPRSWNTDDNYGGILLNDYPVVAISWYEARAYAKWAGKRLPTDEEWEYAAGYDPATGTKRIFPWGNQWQKQWGNFLNRKPLPVANFKKTDVSPWQCYNMGGNAAEWTVSAEGKPGLRGGSFMTGEWSAKARITNIRRSRAVARPGYTGFRCARDAE